MADLTADVARPDQDWLARFEAAPEREFDRVMSGVALIPPYGLADPVTVLPAFFGALEPDDPRLHQLDAAACSWLERWRRISPADRRAYGLKRYVCDGVAALTVVQHLPLAETRAHLRRCYGAYLRWAEGLTFGSARDLRARLWYALAEDQPDARFQVLWQHICRDTGRGIYPPHYLTIGLLGLRRLRIADRTPDEDRTLTLMLGGLGAWAAGLDDTETNHKAFLQEWGLLNWLHTRPSRGAWRRLADPALIASRGTPSEAWWREVLGYERAGAAPPRLVREPDVADVRKLLDDLNDEPLASLRPQIRTLIAKRRDWAQVTGSTYYLSRTAGNIAGRIIDQDAVFAADLVTEALDWEPNNEILWNLWARALLAQGRIALAEAVLWESVRRFPDDEPSQVELGRVLAGAGRLDEAAAVLTTAVDRFPDREPCHVELARLWAWRGDLAKAIGLLSGFTDRSPSQEIALTHLGHFLTDAGRLDDARTILERLQRLNAQRALAELASAIRNAETGRVRSPRMPGYQFAAAHRETGAVAGAGDPGALDALRLDARITRADFNLSPAASAHIAEDRRAAVREDLAALLDEHPDHAYGRLVAYQRGVTPDAGATLLEDFPAVYELRLAVALHRGDREALIRLRDDDRHRGPITRLALCAIGSADDDDGRRAGAWVQRSAPPGDDLLAAYVHRAVRAVLSRAGIGLEDGNAIADRLATLAGRVAVRAILEDHATRMVNTQSFAGTFRLAA